MGIPERSWFRSSFPEIEDKVVDIVRRWIDPTNPVMPDHVANIIGEAAKGILQARLAEGKYPAPGDRLSERTIASKMRRGKNPPYTILIETGTFRTAITFTID